MYGSLLLIGTIWIMTAGLVTWTATQSTKDLVALQVSQYRPYSIYLQAPRQALLKGSQNQTKASQCIQYSATIMLKSY